MNARTALAAAIAAAMMTMTATLWAAETPTRKRELIDGYSMMTDPERNEFRKRMRNARDADERQSLRDEHHEPMDARAKARGATLAEPRGPRGEGKGPGYGPGLQGK